MEPKGKKPKFKLSSELDQEPPRKKKGVWQKILEVLEHDLRKGEEREGE